MAKKKAPVSVSVVLTEEEAIAVRYALQCMRGDIGDVAEPSDPTATWSAIRIDLEANTYWAIEKAQKILNKQLGF
ncbi:MAG: hypothetical protein ACYTGV_16080 [Planctomycetota bacterium]|jgi:hypothetical protein